MAEWRATTLGLSLALQVGCGAGDGEARRALPAGSSAPEASVALLEPPELAAPESAPKARPARRCTLELRTRAHGLRGGSVQIDVSVRNPTGKAVLLSYPDRCPLGPVSLAGLGAGYDYYHGCNKGACVGPRPALRSALAPGASETLVRLEIDPRGGSCRPRLAPGARQLVASLPGATPAVCDSAPLTVQIGAAGELAPAVPAAPGADPQSL